MQLLGPTSTLLLVLGLPIGSRWIWLESHNVGRSSANITSAGLQGAAKGQHRGEAPELHTIVGLTSTVLLLPATFALTQIQATKANVWKLLDQFLAIFLAVVLSDTFVELTSVFPADSGLPTLAAEAFRFVAMYVVVIMISWPLRREPKSFSSFCSVFSHFVSFLGIRSLGLVQAHCHSLLVHPLLTLLAACGILALMLMCKSATGRFIFHESRNEVDKKWHEETDELGWDVAGMVLAYMFTQAMHFVLLGKFDNLSDPKATHTWQEVVFFAIYASVLLVVGASLIPLLDVEQHSRHWLVFNSAHVARNFVAMTMAWALLLSVKWLLFEHSPLEGCSEMFAALTLAIALSATAILLLWLRLLTTGHRVRNKRGKSAMHLMLQSLGLVCAWSWEECFDDVAEAASLHTAHISGAKEVRIASAVFFIVVLAPLYVNFVKPKVEESMGNARAQKQLDEVAVAQQRLEVLLGRFEKLSHETLPG